MITMSSAIEDIKGKLAALNEPWTHQWDVVARHAPNYVSAYITLRSVPFNKRHLLPKMQELVLLAVDASCTHLFVPGIKLHTAQALKAGATKEEIVEVLQLVSVLGIHATTIGVSTLVDVLEEEGKLKPDQDIFNGKNLGKYREELKENFQKARGYWSIVWDHILALGESFFPSTLSRQLNLISVQTPLY